MTNSAPGTEGFYPTGLFGRQDPYLQYDEPFQLQVQPGQDPSWVSGPVLDMSVNWEPIDIVARGTQGLRLACKYLLPQEPSETDDSWNRRVSKATLSPFTARIAEQAAGLILRKGIQVLPNDYQEIEGAELDPFWDEFCQSVDGRGTPLETFCRRVLISSLLYGHSVILTDMPNAEPAANLREERERGITPYFAHYDAQQILGWRQSDGGPTSPIDQVRINEIACEPKGRFGQEYVRQIRVLEPGKWQVWRKSAEGWAIHEEGTTNINKIPLAVSYSNKVAEYISKPPLLSIANLNISHAQANCDLQHALHVSALPILLLKGFDDSDIDGTIGLSANSAILLPCDGDGKFVEPASSSFDAQQAYLDRLEAQMRQLGISTLFSQLNSPETAESKQTSRIDSDSLLSIVSKNLEDALQEAFNHAASYLNKEAPKILIDRDFNLQQLDGAAIAQYMALFNNGVITHETLLEILVKGECLSSDFNVELEVELTDQAKLDSMDTQAAGGTEPQAEREEASDTRVEVEARLKAMAQREKESTPAD
nr:phage portal protein [uncultured Mediterranean phage uvMED]